MGRQIRLIYSSSVTEAGRRQGPSLLPDILLTSARNNDLVQVSGMLLAFNDGFLQVLEGSEPTVHAIFDRVREDRRHREVRIVDQSGVSTREFGQWAMCGRDLAASDNAILKVLSLKTGLRLQALSAREAMKLLLAVRAIQTRTPVAA